MDKKSSNKFAPLPLVSAKDANKKTIDFIQDNRQSTPNYLESPWSNINARLYGGFRFKNIYMIGGTSGVGKSYFLNILIRHFLKQKEKVRSKFKIIYLTFEMDVVSENLRTIVTNTGISYEKLLNSNTLTNEEYAQIVKAVAKLDDPDLIFVENSGNIYQVYNTVKGIKTKYPNHELVICCDHTLLFEAYAAENEVAMISSVSKLARKLKKELGAMVIYLLQLNDNIEDPLRIRDPNLHYPKKGDIFGSKSVYQTGDVVIVLHAPEMLGIKEYGPLKWPTKDLLAVHFLKWRFGSPGVTKLKRNMQTGVIQLWSNS